VYIFFKDNKILRDRECASRYSKRNTPITLVGLIGAPYYVVCRCGWSIRLGYLLADVYILGLDSINNVRRPTPVTHGGNMAELSRGQAKFINRLGVRSIRDCWSPLRSRIRERRARFSLRPRVSAPRQIRGPITSGDNGETAGYDRTRVVDIVRRIRRVDKCLGD